MSYTYVHMENTRRGVYIQPFESSLQSLAFIVVLRHDGCLASLPTLKKKDVVTSPNAATRASYSKRIVSKDPQACAAT